MPSVLSPGPQPGKIGKYLMQVGYHTDAVTCTMFLTSMAGNPLCVGLAATAVGVEITWMNWAVAAIVSGFDQLVPGSGSDAQTFSS